MIDILVTAAVLCNNYNWQHSERCNAPVAYFQTTEVGYAGILESGVTFTQIKNPDGTQTFRMEDVCWVTDGLKTEYCETTTR